MPRILGVNLAAWLAAAVAIYFIGFLIYGLAFSTLWAQQTLIDHGLATPESASSLTMTDIQKIRIPGAMDTTMAMSLGAVISIVTALGVCVAQRLMKPDSLGAAISNGFVLWFGFGATTLAYNVVYSSNSPIVYGIDLLHLFLDYTIASAVVFMIDRKAISGPSA